MLSRAAGRERQAGAIDLVDRLPGYFGSHAKPGERTERFMERVGMDTLKADVLAYIPYIPLEKVE